MPKLRNDDPKSAGFDTTKCAKFQVIPVRSFCFIILTYPHTYIETLRNSDVMWFWVRKIEVQRRRAKEWVVVDCALQVFV